MRIKLIVALLLLTVTNFAKAQTPAPIPSGYTGPVNYVRVWEPVKPYTSVSDVTNTSRTTKEVRQTTQYFDGLGRPLQTVIKNGSLDNSTTPTSPVQRDMVMPVVYDDFGREQLKYLPYASTNATDGNFKTDPFTEQVTFYNNQLSGQTGETNAGGTSRNWAYSKTNFEASPLSRVNEAYAPGASWVGSEGGSTPHPVKMKYWINTATDAVRIWNVTDVTNGFGTYATTSTYNAGELYKNVTEDEHGKQVIEFKDKEGKVILKKVQLTATAETSGAGSDHTGWLCTYYIYDDLNNLRAVVQPEGVKTLAQYNWDFSQVPASIGGATTLLNEQTFRYEYDQRNRMIMKKVPGAGEVYMVYDPWDRLLLTQDANMRANGQYLFTKYDALNRPVMTGIYTNSATIQDVRNVAATYAPYRYEERVSSAQGYTSRCWPEYNYEVLTVTYYDDYTWYGNPFTVNRNTDFDNVFMAASNENYPYPQPLTQSLSTKGMVTGGMVKVLGTSQFLHTINSYDDKGRVIQVRTKNITDWVDVLTTQYDFSGKPLVQYSVNPKNFSPSQTDYVLTKYSYDDLGRVADIKKTMNSHIGGATWISSPEVQVVKNEYDKLGQLKKKEIGKKRNTSDPAQYTSTPIETLAYDYNIRGWMLGMNRKYLNNTSSSDYAGNYFGFELGYDKAENKSGANFFHDRQYNGNISGMVWKSTGDQVRRKYDFRYDAVNRLGTADFTQNSSADGGTFSNSEMDYTVYGENDPGNNYFIRYDDNGNILKMTQRGWKIGAPTAAIDQLTYTYYTGTNKLQAVTDAVTAENKLGDFFDKNNGATDYTYDANGNLKKDLNKDMGNGSNEGIVYNHLNLPSVVAIRKTDGSIKGTITYSYDASGNKLKKVVDEYPSSTNGNFSTVTTTMYIGGFVYESKVDTNPNTTDYTNKLQFGGHEEGRIRALYNDANVLTGFAYDYMLKDHLGNVRMVLTDELQNSIYPVASVEDATVNCENAFYAINSSKVVAKPSHDPNGVLNYQNNNVIPAGPCGNGSGTNAKMYRLFATGSSADVGLSMTLKVMSGDVINIWGKSFYNDANSSETNYTTTAAQLIAGFLSGGLGGATASGHGATPTLLQNNTGTVGGLNSFITDPNRGTGTLPKAYVNWVLFDEQFKFVSGSFSRVDQVANTIKDHRFTDVPVTKNGYLYIYVSNESPVAVFFDNLQVVHTKGPVLEETHYYPFGLSMNGISSKALNGATENKYKFNGIELNNSFDLNMYDAFYRNLDPQIGRFWQIDPKPNENFSLYSVMMNNPILYNDFLGDTVKYANDRAQEMVHKFSSRTITKRGKEVTNKNYNEAFAAVISRLDASVDNFVFNFDANAKEGLVSYDGTNVNVTIAEPGDEYGTNVGAEGILFEETKHAEQILDGQVYFTPKADGTWGSSNNIQNEVEAKTFAFNNLQVNKTYKETQSGSNYMAPTQLGYMKYNLKTDVQRATFLQQGASGLNVIGDYNRSGTVSIPGAYPTLTNQVQMNTLTRRTKTSQVFGYPRR